MTNETELLREMAAALPDPVFVLSESGRYLAVAGGNDAELYHDGSHLVGQHVQDVLPTVKADWILDQIRKTLQEDRVRTVEYALAGDDVDGLDKRRGPDGDLWFEARIQPMASPQDGERAVVWVARNITSRSELEAKLRWMSETDVLTNTFNRRKLLEELEERLREYRRYGHETALIMLDVDRFKEVNDTLGHHVGDDVLRCTARTCMEELRDVDVLCRIGGDEFAIILPSTTADAAYDVAERLRARIEAKAAAKMVQEDTPTVSVGVAALGSGDASVEDILRRADQALYGAKRGGRNRVMASAVAAG